MSDHTGDIAFLSFSQSDKHIHTWVTEARDLTEMLIKSEGDRNGQWREGRKGSKHIPLSKPSSGSLDKIRLPLSDTEAATSPPMLVEVLISKQKLRTIKKMSFSEC